MVAVSDSHVLRLAPVSGPLAGRADELDRLRDAWQRALAGTFQLVLLTGEGGVGKTRLATELACEAEAAGAIVLFGGWSPAGGEPCEGLTEALGPPVPAAAGPADRDAMFEALAASLAARALESPVLVVLDDLHRADRTSFLALRHIMDMPAGSSVLILGVYRETSVGRSHPLAEFHAAVRDRGNVERLLLEGLSPVGVGELVGDTELGWRVWRQCGGNPLLAGELLRTGALDVALPPSFEDLLAERIGRLGEGTGRVLEAAAVVGPRFTVPVLAATTGLPPERVRSALREASAAGLIVEDPAHPEVHRFAHDMVREAIELRLPAERRLPLHLAAGRALARLRPPSGASPAALAWHFRAGAPVGGSVLARRHSARAGNRAMELLAWDEAAAQYGHALAAAAGSGPATRADLLLSLGEAQRRAGEAARARQSFLESAGAARQAGDGPRLARAAAALGRVSAVWGDDPTLDRLAGEARALGQDATMPATAGRGVDFASGDLYDVLDGADAGSSGPPPPEATAGSRGGAAPAAILQARHRALAGPGHPADRLVAAEELIGLAAGHGDDELVATGRGWRMLDLLELGRVAEAAAEQASHAEVAGRLAPSSHHRSDAAAWAGMWALLEGNSHEARAAAEHALVVATAAGDPEAAATFLLQRWALALEWGTAAERSEVVGACRDQAAGAATPAEWRAALALLLVRCGDVDRAAEELRRVTGGGLGAVARDPRRLYTLTCLAEVTWAVGDETHASLVAALLEPFAGQLVVVGRGVACLGSVARACGLAAAGARRWDDAERHFRSALDVHRRIGASALLARTHHDWSQVLAGRGRKADRRRAAESRRKWREVAARLGMDHLSQ